MAANVAEEAKGAWEEAVKKLARNVAHYRIDAPNVPHILNAVEVLGIETVTLDNIGLVVAALIERVKANERWTEAPASWNIRYDNAFGAGEQITLRGERYADIAADADTARRWVLEHTRPVSGKAQEAQPAAPAPAGALPVAQAQSGGLSFAAKTLVGSVTEGKTYWKVKGGKFEKYGVTVWPEVLEAAGLTNLNPMQAYDLNGWTAHYSIKDGDKADKVVRLAKP